MDAAVLREGCCPGGPAGSTARRGGEAGRDRSRPPTLHGPHSGRGRGRRFASPWLSSPSAWGGDCRGSGSATSYMVTATRAGLLGALRPPLHLQSGDKRNHSLPGQSEPRGRVHRKSTSWQVGAARCPRDGRLKLGERKRVSLAGAGVLNSTKEKQWREAGASLQEPPCAPVPSPLSGHPQHEIPAGGEGLTKLRLVRTQEPADS